MPLRRRKQWWGVTLDAPDGAALGRFYARLLDWQFFPAENGLGGAVSPGADAGYNLGFQTEENYVRPVWPAEPGRPQMSMHLEIEVDDLDEAVAHAVAVGATRADFQPQATVRVMIDPAGHPFCLYLDESEPASGDGGSGDGGSGDGASGEGEEADVR
ncbi:VOC family protein [Actinoplanes sp. M2I2]|uniref:VOC family protein n=1 Tax=Actinoplanes sp. M2I2 TaxID=1734444 RepID=UPI0027E120DC|nr:VOC family protein [Actinoplanes sp. M2I2]